ncbi:hypothetical protein [Sporosarcina sp. FSL K6-1508]|uniref:hypothetical protein n=1 Tax=Sporosarcina sp. FSL K6-1508 TaxID=2921553 RepID=UPI0030FBBA53
MKRVENLQESLKKLPKYTLDDEQKEKIILAMKKGTKSRKRVKFVKSLTALTLICAVVFVLVLSSDSESNNWLNELKQSFRPQVELTAQLGEIFNFSQSNQEVTGIEGKVGMLFNEQFVAEDARKGAKMMLYFWIGASELAGKSYTVEARDAYDKKIIMSEGVFDGFLFEEDVQQVLTSFTPFPKEGKWQLSFYVEDQLFEEFTIEVLPPFPKTEHYTLVNHPMELTVGESTEALIVSEEENGKEIEVKLLNNKGKVISEHVFFQNTPQDNYYYGSIKFPEKGIWKLMINGEKTQPFKN